MIEVRTIYQINIDKQEVFKKYINANRITRQQQMFVISGCLMKLGYRDLAILAQSSDNLEYVCDFVNIIKVEAQNRSEYALLDQLHNADLI